MNCKILQIAFATTIGTILSAQSNPIPGNPVTIGSKLGVGTTTPSQKFEVVASDVWDGMRITSTQPGGAGAYLGMASLGGSNRFFNIYLDARPGVEDALKLQTNSPAIQFWTLLGNPFQIMTLKAGGDVVIAGDVYSRGVKLGSTGQALQGPPGPQGIPGPIGPRGETGPQGIPGDAQRTVAVCVNSLYGSVNPKENDRCSQFCLNGVVAKTYTNPGSQANSCIATADTGTCNWHNANATDFSACCVCKQ